MIKIGQKVRFDPFEDDRAQGIKDCRGDVVGIVRYINEPHQYFMVEYGEPPVRVCFKFADLFAERCKKVEICG
jgi:hypothetical protein